MVLSHASYRVCWTQSKIKIESREEKRQNLTRMLTCLYTKKAQLKGSLERTGRSALFFLREHHPEESSLRMIRSCPYDPEAAGKVCGWVHAMEELDSYATTGQQRAVMWPGSSPLPLTGSGR